jgi:hypothetical protein
VTIVLEPVPEAMVSETKMMLEEAKHLEGLIHCPSCTYLNPIEEERCKMCDALMFGS